MISAPTARKLFFETQHLLVYHPDEADTENLVSIQTDPEVMRYFGGARTRQQALEKIQYFLNHYHQYRFSVGVIFHKMTGEFIGRVGLVHFGLDDRQTEIEVAIILHKKFWGCGFAQESLRGLIDWTFTHLSIGHLVAVCDPKNIRSLRVIQKVGFQQDSTIEYFEKPAFKFILQRPSA